MGGRCSQTDNGQVCAITYNFSFSVLSTFNPCVPFFSSRGLEDLITKVDDEDVNDVGFKDALVMQDIGPIGGLSRVVLSTIMNEGYVPLEYKALLFCFATNPTEDEEHHAFARFSCQRQVNIFQM